MSQNTALILPDISNIPLRYCFPETVNHDASIRIAQLLMATPGGKKIKFSKGTHIEMIYPEIEGALISYLSSLSAFEIALSTEGDNLCIWINYSDLSPIFYMDILDEIRKDMPGYEQIFTSIMAHLEPHTTIWTEKVEDYIQMNKYELKEEKQNEERDFEREKELRSIIKKFQQTPAFPNASIPIKELKKELDKLSYDTERGERLHTWLSGIIPFLSPRKIEYEDYDNANVLVMPGEVTRILYDGEHITTKYFDEEIEDNYNSSNDFSTKFKIPFKDIEEPLKVMNKLTKAIKSYNLYAVLSYF